MFLFVDASMMARCQVLHRTVWTCACGNGPMPKCVHHLVSDSYRGHLIVFADAVLVEVFAVSRVVRRDGEDSGIISEMLDDGGACTSFDELCTVILQVARNGWWNGCDARSRLPAHLG